MGSNKRVGVKGSELTKHGWKVVDVSAGSTTLSSALSRKEVAEMKKANANPGFLSAGNSAFSTALFGAPIAKPRAVASSTRKSEK